MYESFNNCLLFFMNVEYSKIIYSAPTKLFWHFIENDTQVRGSSPSSPLHIPLLLPFPLSFPFLFPLPFPLHVPFLFPSPSFQNCLKVPVQRENYFSHFFKPVFDYCASFWLLATFGGRGVSWLDVSPRDTSPSKKILVSVRLCQIR